MNLWYALQSSANCTSYTSLALSIPRGHHPFFCFPSSVPLTCFSRLMWHDMWLKYASLQYLSIYHSNCFNFFILILITFLTLLSTVLQNIAIWLFIYTSLFCVNGAAVCRWLLSVRVQLHREAVRRKVRRQMMTRRRRKKTTELRREC